MGAQLQLRTLFYYTFIMVVVNLFIEFVTANFCCEYNSKKR